MSSGSMLELRDAVVALEADGGDAVLDRQALGVDLPFAVADLAGPVDHRLHAEIADAGRLAGRRRAATVPKNQKPVSATPMKSLPGVRKRNADSAPKSRGGEVISSPPTNSSGPNCFSSRPMWKLVIGRDGNLDALGLGWRSRARGARAKAATSQEQRPEAASPRTPRERHPARRMPPRRVSRASSSPNSEASCSVMAPASSSASTMVTARR